MDSKQQEKREQPSSQSIKFCMPQRRLCLIMAYLTLFHTSSICVCILGLLYWLFTQEESSDQWSCGYTPLIFVLLFYLMATVLVIICLVGIHKKLPELMNLHILFTKVRMTVTVLALGYSLLAAPNFAMISLELADIGYTVFYIFVFKTYMNQLYREVANYTNKSCEKIEDIKKVPIV